VEALTSRTRVRLCLVAFQSVSVCDVLSRRRCSNLCPCEYPLLSFFRLSSTCLDEFLFAAVDTVQGQSEATRVLRASHKRAFTVVWSPLLPNVLASCGDDCVVTVWNSATGESKVCGDAAALTMLAHC
jgi:WD40 repeat protein